jgi:hypothetical protein
VDVRTGVSAEALRFLWGHTYYTEGYAGPNEYGYYVGSIRDLAESTRPAIHYGLTLMRVYFVDGRLKWWLEIDGLYKK